MPAYFNRFLILRTLAVTILAGASMAAQAQSAIQTGGALIIVPAFGEVKHPNDQARLTLMIEEQDKDKSAAASRVNQKMRQGTEIVKKEDPKAILRTRGYYSYPVYPDEQPRPAGKARQPSGWRVGQYLDVTTTSLGTLEKTVAAAQSALAVNSLYFGLSEATARKLDEQRIGATWKNLNERIGFIANAMGRNPADAVLDTVDFEGSGAYAQQDVAAPKMMRAGAAQEAATVQEPSFEPGETTLQMRAVGKLKFK